MNFLFRFLIVFSFTVSSTFALDVTLLKNNKESFSRLVTKKDQAALKAWTHYHRLGKGLRMTALEVLHTTMLEFSKRKAHCDPGLAELLMKNALKADVMDDEDDFRLFVALLREDQQIDDILMGILLKGEKIRQDLAGASRFKKPKSPRGLLPVPEGLDLKKYFSLVTPWPDEIGACSIGRYFRMAESLTYKSSAERDKLLWRIAHHGLKDGLIDAETFHRLEALRLNQALELNHYVSSYLSMLSSAKDKMAKTREAVATHQLSSKIISRKEQLTQRGRLYKVFSPSQVMIMSGVIEKLARRLDARRVELIFQYGQEPGTGDSQIYVLSPMEQYRVSIRMMKKEMAELMRGDLFSGTGITYEDIIASSFETGLLKSSELEALLKFEEFWNPKAPSRFRTYANFAFSVAGTATFYLPPPWNLMGAVALMFTQSRLMPSRENPDPEDNWNVII